MRANHEQMKNQFKAAQQQPILDLDAMAAAHHFQIEQKDAQLRQQTTDAWLKFYNGLNDQQKDDRQHGAEAALCEDGVASREDARALAAASWRGVGAGCEGQ